jgi:hypothetical protein
MITIRSGDTLQNLVPNGFLTALSNKLQLSKACISTYCKKGNFGRHSKKALECIDNQIVVQQDIVLNTMRAKQLIENYIKDQDATKAAEMIQLVETE